jgi:hypothetical protein
MVAGGSALARDAEGRVVFVGGALPGERVQVEVETEHRGYLTARLVEVLEPSAHRVAPPCPELARGCGACQWQHIDVAEQRTLKQDIVLDALTRIGKLDVAPATVRPTVELEPWSFRTTIRADVVNGRAGFRRARSHASVAVNDCLVAHPLLVPLVTEARTWVEGVYMAATMGSETTAAMAGGNGAVRRDPFAMLPFTGYNMADYFQHWLDLGDKLATAGATLPRIFCVNWFRKGADGKFVWPGYGENMRALEWMIGRIEGRAGGADNVFGTSPRYEDMRWDGLAFTREQFASVIGIDRAAWKQELALHAELFQTLSYHLPAALPAVRSRIEERLAAG